MTTPDSKTDELVRMLTEVMEKTKQLIDEGHEMDDREGDGMALSARTIRDIPGLRQWWREEQSRKKSE
jgi:hypothetical protein